MSEGSFQTETSKKNEGTLPSVQTRIITRNHLPTYNLNEQQRSGNLKERMWPDSVQEVVAYNPKILSVDSLRVVEADMNLNDKLYALAMIPINPKESISVVAGDTSFVWRKSIEEFVNAYLQPTSEMQDKVKDALNIATESPNRLDAKAVNLALPGKRNEVAVHVLAAVLPILGYSAFEMNKFAKQWEKTTSRRNVLKMGIMAGKLGGLIAILHFVDKVLPSSNKTIMTIELNSPEDTVEIDGRTAILIQKGEDAAKELGGGRLAVVAGATHAHNSELLRNNQDSREKAIKAYAQVRLDLLEKLAFELKMTDEQRENARNELIESLCKMQLLTANRIENEIVPKDQVEDIMKNAITAKPPVLSPEMVRILKELPDAPVQSQKNNSDDKSQKPSTSKDPLMF